MGKMQTTTNLVRITCDFHLLDQLELLFAKMKVPLNIGDALWFQPFVFWPFWLKSWMKSREELADHYSVKEPALGWKRKLLAFTKWWGGCGSLLGSGLKVKDQCCTTRNERKNQNSSNMFEKLGFGENVIPRASRSRRDKVWPLKRMPAQKLKRCRAAGKTVLAIQFESDLGSLHQEFGQLALQELVRQMRKTVFAQVAMVFDLKIAQLSSLRPWWLQRTSRELSGGSWLARV